MGYTLSRAAIASLTDIYAYSYETWGAVQADKYLDGIYDCFDRILSQSELWRPIPAAFEISGYYTRYEKHLIYWKQFEDGTVGIAAIIHHSRHQIDRLKEMNL